MNELGLGVAFSARDAASGILRNVTSELLNVTGASSEAGQAIKASFQQFSTGLAVFGAGATTLAGAMKLADISGEFSASIAAVGAVSGASVADLKRLEEAALDAGVATQFNPKEAAVGLGDLAQAGYSASESMALLNPVLDLAAGSLGELSPSGAAGLASQTLKAFKIPISEASITMDRLLQSVNAFALSAGELPLALGTAARGAGVMNQSLSETLIALGLVKNVMPSVERASTSVAVAMERMVDPATQTALKGLGVNVTDADGKFRPFLDIIQELMPALAGMGNESKQSAFLLKTFGTEGLGGIQALLAQLSGGLKTSTGEMVKGAAAVDYLRGSFDHAEGTAEGFAKALRDTYEGQKKLLDGSMNTLGTVIGKPFEDALKPIVTIFADAVNGVIKAVRSLPTPVTDFIAKAVLFAGTVMTVVGGMLAFKASIGLVSAGLSAIGVSTTSFLATLWPVVAVLGIAVAGFYAFKAAYEENLGGFGDFARDMYKTVSLAFRALGQLFSQGGFSGAVLTELEDGNVHVEDFAINVYLAVNRIQSFFEGLSDGFGSAMKKLGPTFDAFMEAIRALGAAFFGVVDGPEDAQKAFDSFGRAGKKTGDTLAVVADILVRAATAFVNLVIEAKPLIDTFVSLVGHLAESGAAMTVLELILVSMAINRTREATSSVLNFGKSIAGIAGSAATGGAGISSFGAACLGAVDPVMALSFALVSLYNAKQTLDDLDEKSHGHGMALWLVNAKHNLGILSDEEYNAARNPLVEDASVKGWKDHLARSDMSPLDNRLPDTFASSGSDLNGGQSFGTPTVGPLAVYDAPVGPLAAYDPPVAAQVAGASSDQSVNVGALNDSASSLASSAQSLQAAHEGTTIIRATLKMDSREVGEMISEAQRSSSSDNQVPVSLIP